MIDLAEFAGIPVRLDPEALTLSFGPGVTTAPAVVRRLDEVRALLRDPQSSGPDHLYTIYMDIRVPGPAEALLSLGLGYGAVVYNHGTPRGPRPRDRPRPPRPRGGPRPPRPRLPAGALPGGLEAPRRAVTP